MLTHSPLWDTPTIFPAPEFHEFDRCGIKHRLACSVLGDKKRKDGMRTPRLVFVDNIRILLAALVILHHAAVTYGAPGGWYYSEPASDIVAFASLTLFVVVNQSFFMGLFFLLAGYFTPASYDRKGAKRFLGDRALRLGVPIIVYAVVFEPLLTYILSVTVDGYAGTLGQFLRMRLVSYRGLQIGPLWFTQALLLLALTYTICRAFLPNSHTQIQEHHDTPSSGWVLACVVILGLIAFVARQWFPVNAWVPYLNLQPAHVTQYICLFIVGLHAYRRQWLTNLPASQGKLWSGIAALCVAVFFAPLFILGGAAQGNVAVYLGGAHWQCFVYALWEQFVGVAMILGILTLFRKRLNRENRLTRSLAPCAYAAYIVHPLVLVPLALAVRNVQAPSLAKFLLLGVLGVPACFALAAGMRRLPLVRRVL